MTDETRPTLKELAMMRRDFAATRQRWQPCTDCTSRWCSNNLQPKDNTMENNPTTVAKLMTILANYKPGTLVYMIDSTATLQPVQVYELKETGAGAATHLIIKGEQ